MKGRAAMMNHASPNTPPTSSSKILLQEIRSRKDSIQQMNTLFLTLLMFLSPDPNPANLIFWEPGAKITWADFKAKPVKGDKHAAISHCGFNVGYETSDKTMTIVVKAFFDKSKSWVRPDARSENLLAHEQGHFDIAELFARKMRQDLKNADYSDGNFDNTIQSIFQSTMGAYRIYQDSYDEATNFSINHSAQIEWNAQIRNSLDDLEDSKGVEVSVEIGR